MTSRARPTIGGTLRAPLAREPDQRQECHNSLEFLSTLRVIRKCDLCDAAMEITAVRYGARPVASGSKRQDPNSKFSNEALHIVSLGMLFKARKAAPFER